MIIPEHMDKASRNLRLYETLKGMGLYVDPITDEANPDAIIKMVVSADLPFPQISADQRAKQSAERGIGGTTEGPEVENVVGPADGLGRNVIDFPTVGRR
ncbi:MAG: hypothetical protein COA37_02055 [Hoeflea sp.]|uniref:hypothetical protein n=1 Tax=Hoeflea sp. TaxID=1940281 RepID=UPI000C0EE263|nr:hypothetical protein [Hoeflea sp.]PHR25632.1 MAG: hypothetical protein COA37_02055 [Hoeflea sp.]